MVNCGFATYGYRFENRNLVYAEDDVEVISIIYARYIYPNEVLSVVANYFNNHVYTKKLL